MAKPLSRPRTPRPPRLDLVWNILVVIAMGVAITIVTLLVVWWGLLGHPPLRSPLPNSFGAADRYDLIKIALTVTGGVGAATALVIGYRKQRLAELSHTREDTRLFNERYATAATQLGSEKAAVRLAGVYAMTSLADDWAIGRQTCIDVLCAYLRMPYRPPRAPNVPAGGGDPTEDGEDGERAAHEERQVRHTIIRIVRDHLWPGAPVGWRGYELDFTAAVLDGADFSSAEFLDTSVSFRSARFVGGRTSFDRAVFRPSAEVSFEGAEFDATVVSFKGAEFVGGRVLFQSATLVNGAVVDLSKPARWKYPPRLDGWLVQPPEGLRLPGFQNELRATLNGYDSRFVLLSPDTDGKTVASVRKAYGIPAHELPIAYARQFAQEGGIACTDRALRIADKGERIAIPFDKLGDTAFLGDAAFEIVPVDATTVNDQAIIPNETTNVHIRYQGADLYLQFGGPIRNAIVFDVLRAVQQMALRHSEQLQARKTTGKVLLLP